MKKLLKNKKVIVALVLVLAFAVGGLTYAWFTVNAVGGTAPVQAGRLRLENRRFTEYGTELGEGDKVIPSHRVYYDRNGGVSKIVIIETGEDYGTIEIPDEWILTERWYDPATLIEPMPAEYAYKIGVELTNPNPDGLALAETVKIVDQLSDIVIRSGIDEDGNAVELEEEDFGGPFANMEELLEAYDGTGWAQDGDLLYAMADGTIENIIYFDADGNALGMIYWEYDYTVYEATGKYEYYVHMSPMPADAGLKLDLITTVGLTGQAGNLYQGCTMDVSSNFKSTQTVVEAIMALWGNDLDLRAVSSDFTIIELGGAQPFSTASYDGPMVKAAEVGEMDIQELVAIFFPGLNR